MIDTPFAEPPARMSRREWRDLQMPSAPVRSSGGALSILTVCTGNICRSPMAELVLRARLEELDVRVQSAGTHALVGHEMTGPARDLAVEAGAAEQTTAGHAARYLVEPMLAGADLVLTMTRAHRSHAVTMVPASVRRTFTVRQFARLASALTTEDARAAADAAGSDSKARFAATLRAIVGRRAHSDIGIDPADDDVIDPYRRSHETYLKAAEQLIPPLDEVERIVRAALG